MKRRELLCLSTAIVIMGGAEVFRPPHDLTLNRSPVSCTVCVPPPVFCIDYSEWDGVCEENCGGVAVQCPAAGPECPPTDDVLFCTG